MVLYFNVLAQSTKFNQDSIARRTGIPDCPCKGLAVVVVFVRLFGEPDGAGGGGGPAAGGAGDF